MFILNKVRSAGGLSLAIAMAAAALPATAFAQDHGHWNRGGGEARGQWQGNGGNGNGDGGGRGHRWGGSDGAVQQQQQPQSSPRMEQPRGRWSGGNAGSEGWANRVERTQRGGQWQGNAPSSEAAPRTWRNDGAGQVVTPQPQWSPRNRTYSDPSRNETYRQTWRGGSQDENWRNRTDNNWRSGNDWRNRTDNDWRSGNDWRNRTDNTRRGNYGDNHRRWDRDWRRDSRYNWSGYRSQNRDHYRMGRYYAPYGGYSYRRLGIGFSLGPLFYSERYWIDDPWSYRLPEAYGPYRWVRYFDDALLVNIYDGEVVDVIYDFFW